MILDTFQWKYSNSMNVVYVTYYLQYIVKDKHLSASVTIPE